MELDAAYVNKMYSLLKQEGSPREARAAWSLTLHVQVGNKPGSELFVVYNEERDMQIPGLIRNRALIIKRNRVFRL